MRLQPAGFAVVGSALTAEVDVPNCRSVVPVTSWCGALAVRRTIGLGFVLARREQFHVSIIQGQLRPLHLEDTLAAAGAQLLARVGRPDRQAVARVELGLQKRGQAFRAHGVATAERKDDLALRALTVNEAVEGCIISCAALLS